jgi:cell division protein FtsX
MYVGFPGADESGQFEIVGVAAHVRGDSVENPTGDGVFVIYAQIPPDYSPLTFVMRMADGADLGPLTSMVRSVAKGCDVRSTRIDERYARLYGDARVAVDITSGFGLIALVIAVVGVYALMAFLVTGRTREIGIRMALGASPGDIRRLVLGSSISFVSVGAVLGVAAAAAASHWVQAELFGVSALDPVTYCAVCAAWQPARRAARIAPALTLRAE